MGDSEQPAVGKNLRFLNGPSPATALATYAHFNTRLTGTQCGGLCCATQRRDSHGGNFCLTGDILSDGMQGLVAWDGPEQGGTAGQKGYADVCERKAPPLIPALKIWVFLSIMCLG